MPSLPRRGSSGAPSRQRPEIRRSCRWRSAQRRVMFRDADGAPQRRRSRHPEGRGCSTARCGARSAFGGLPAQIEVLLGVDRAHMAGDDIHFLARRHRDRQIAPVTGKSRIARLPERSAVGTPEVGAATTSSAGKSARVATDENPVAPRRPAAGVGVSGKNLPRLDLGDAQV